MNANLAVKTVKLKDSRVNTESTLLLSSRLVQQLWVRTTRLAEPCKHTPLSR